MENPAGILIPIPLTHEDLANLIGTTRDTVTTQLNNFERMGILSRQNRRIIVHRSRLTEFIHSERVRVGNLHS